MPQVDYAASRPFCQQCEVRFMPSAHVYVAGQLQAALPIGTKSYATFLETIQAAEAVLRPGDRVTD